MLHALQQDLPAPASHRAVGVRLAQARCRERVRPRKNLQERNGSVRRRTNSGLGRQTRVSGAATRMDGTSGGTGMAGRTSSGPNLKAPVTVGHTVTDLLTMLDQEAVHQVSLAEIQDLRLHHNMPQGCGAHQEACHQALIGHGAPLERCHTRWLLQWARMVGSHRTQQRACHMAGILGIQSAPMACHRIFRQGCMLDRWGLQALHGRRCLCRSQHGNSTQAALPAVPVAKAGALILAAAAALSAAQALARKG
mmetsp:Transcript_91546/g.267899  ORF Transcript_91546/g.267899 Transcript_91546/m.267899 type:complete len:252 (+) Transcript_91546:1083-1838(+)